MATLERAARAARSLATLSAACLLATVVAPAARAAQPDECPTWLPDFRCERHGRYEGFIPTISFPYLFEDPFITTGVTGWALWHELPEHGAFRGGHIRGFAVQARLALTDRVALIATKDGWLSFNPDLAILDRETGWADLAGGIKVALIDAPEIPFILTPSLRYQLTQGSPGIFQGNGQGIWIPALSSAYGIGDLHLIGGVGAQLPVDTGKNSTLLFYNLQIDYALTSFLSPFVSLNGLHYFEGGDGELIVKTDLGPLTLSDAQSALGSGGFEGVDVANLGSADVAGNDILTLALGFRVGLHRGVSLGLAYEFPLTSREDLFDRRATANLVVEF